MNTYVITTLLEPELRPVEIKADRFTREGYVVLFYRDSELVASIESCSALMVRKLN